MFVLLKAEHVDNLLLGKYLLSDARLWQEDGKGVGHVTLLHQVGHQTHGKFERESVLRVRHVDIDPLILQPELVV